MTKLNCICKWFCNFEIAKLDNATGLSNTIPEGAVASQNLTKDFENSSTAGISAMTSGHTVAISGEYAHWGNASMMFLPVAEEDKAYGFYFNVKPVFCKCFTGDL